MKVKVIKRYLPKSKYPDTPLDWKYLRSKDEMVNQVRTPGVIAKMYKLKSILEARFKEPLKRGI